MKAAIAINEEYVKHEGVFRSNTGLIAPAQATVLESRYWSKLVKDVSDLIWIVLGKATHHILENIPGSMFLREETLFFDVPVDGKTYTIQTTMDLFDLVSHVLTDYKITSVWSVTNGLKAEHEAQLNIGAHALRVHGHFPKRLDIIAILRDWSKKQAVIDSYKKWSNYPQVQVKKLTSDIWHPDKVVEYITERIRLHAAAEQLDDHELPLCTPEERWEKPSKFAIKKKGRKNAVKLFDSMDACQDYITNKGWGGNYDYSIEVRHGESPRCQYYCEVKEYCHQWKEMKPNFVKEKAA
jgi:hypothetical protein